MLKRRGCARIDVLAVELERAGMSAQIAEDFAHVLIVNHPYSRRFGLAALECALRERGLGGRAARANATTLLGIELFGQGRAFESVRRELREHGVSDADATAATFDSARILRSARRQAPPVERISAQS